ncbi:MAG: glycosyltransferase [Clostridia bacterium]|nr:glycosyltransferase [Clostridia bacterium]
MKISLCIPMYNEASIIENTARTLSAYMSEHFEDYEILFSNDGSTDDSVELVSALGLPFVRVVGYEKNRGKGAAVREAVLASTGDIVMFTDADLAYGTEVISRVVRAFEEDPQADAVIGSRNLQGDGYEGYTAIRKLASKAYIKLLCAVGGLRLSDSQCGCKAFRGDMARRIFSCCEVNGFAFDFEAIMIGTRLGARFFELPVKVINHRESKVHVLSDALKMIKDVQRMKKRVAKLELKQ